MEITKTHKNVIGSIVAIVAVAIVIQFVRFRSAISKLTADMGAVLPMNYFPFNGTFVKDANGNILKA